MLGLGLHIVIAVLFAIHALRTGREMYWLFILFMFPLLGSIVYAVAVWLPDVRQSRGARRMLSRVGEALDPGRELREAQDAFELSPTVQNRLRLADAWLADGKAEQAAPLYAACLQGLYRDDADITIRYAKALLEAGQGAAARSTLESLIAQQPDLRSPAGHLVYARAVAACGDRAQARHEFDAVLAQSDAFEPRAIYADLLAEWGEPQAAQALAQEALRHLKRMPKHTRELEAQWIERLRRHAG